MKQELLENLIRVCAKEILHQINEGKKSKKCKCGKTLIFGSEKCAVCEAKELNENEEHVEDEAVTEDETQGAPAPPADGLGTDQQPEIPKDPTDIEQDPTEPETPEVPEVPEEPAKKEKLQGVVLYTPSGEMRSVPFRTFADDASIERTLFRVGSSIGGRNTKIAISTFKKVKAGLNDKTPTYIYLGKYDPSSDEPFIFADRDLKVAKEESIKPEEIGSDVANKDLDSQDFEKTSDDNELAAKLAGRDKPSAPEYDEVDPNEMNESVKLKNYIKRFVTEALSRK